MNQKNLFIVSGTSSGIGLALAKHLVVNPQNDVIGIGRSHIIQADNYTAINIDLSDIASVQGLNLPDGKDYRCISMVNNAGILGEIKPLATVDIKNVLPVMMVNYMAPMVMSHLFLAKYQAWDCTKSIINISSGAATSAYPSWANYCSSKAAIEMLTRCMDLEQAYQPFPIQCFAIAPGVVDTKMQTQIRETPSDDFVHHSKFVDLYQENKLYEPSDVAKKIAEVMYQPRLFSDIIFRVTM